MLVWHFRDVCCTWVCGACRGRQAQGPLMLGSEHVPDAVCGDTLRDESLERVWTSTFCVHIGRISRISTGRGERKVPGVVVYRGL